MLGKILFTFLLFIFITRYSSAIITSDADWTQTEQITLEWGDNYSTGDYTINAASFDNEAAEIMFVIYKNNKEIHSAILSATETTQVNTIKLTVNAIHDCGGDIGTPYATITIYTMKPPYLILDATHNMTSEGLVNLTITLENTGGIRFNNIILTATLPGDLIPYKDDSNNYQTSFTSVHLKENESIFTSELENISVGSKETRWMYVEIPSLPQDIIIPIHLHAMGYDLDEKLYNTSKDIDLIIKQALIVNKIPLHWMVNKSEDHLNMNDRVFVSISIFNSATTDALNVTITESIMNSNVVIDPDSDLNWTFDLSSRQSLSFNYFLRPVKPGEVQLSKTTTSREYNGQLYVNSINTTTVTIYGPYMEIFKTLDKYEVSPGDIVNVTVLAKNTGNYAGYLTLTDEIPDFARLIEGSLDKSAIIKPGNELSIDYTLTMEKKGEFRFPAAVGVYTDLEHYRNTAYSTRPLIHIHEPVASSIDESTVIMTIDNNISNINNNSNQTGTLDISGFGFLSGLMIFVIIFLFAAEKIFKLLP
jgi:hypothetical protein